MPTPLLCPIILGLDFSHNYLIGIDWFYNNQLHLHQGPQSIVVLEPAPFPSHVNQISTLPTPHILVKMISQVTIPSRTLAIVPTNFTRTPKPNCYYNPTEMPHKSLQNLIVVPVLNIFGTKLPVCLLCTIINISSDNLTRPKNWHIDEMNLLESSDDSWPSPSVNEVRYYISWDQFNVQYPQTDSFASKMCKVLSNSWALLETSVLIHSNLQIHRQVPLSSAKISKKKNAFYELLQKYDAII